ncbi:MAG TPA: SRPBCC family protein [Solirubrobacteraceae bacterium]|nr:SRPBCC family protein [Solirubrobacteraceae bacterium]
MTQRSVTHATFTVERSYPAPPAEVFAAWADPSAKAQWFGGGDFELDFRVGGRELNRGGPDGGPVFTYDARYYDIVDNERIVYAYEMHMDDTRISVSLATIELTPNGDGTTLVLTESGAFLDGHDTPQQREGGTGSLLDALGTVLARDRAGA